MEGFPCGKLTFLELLETLKSNLELVRCGEGGRVVQDLDPEKRDDGHG